MVRANGQSMAYARYHLLNVPILHVNRKK